MVICLYLEMMPFLVDLCGMEETIVKRVDEQGRVSIPVGWRKDWKSDKVVLRKKGSIIEMIPIEPVSPSTLFDSIEITNDVDFADSHSLKRALMERKKT